MHARPDHPGLRHPDAGVTFHPMLPWYAFIDADLFVGVAIAGLVLAAVLTPLLAPGVHPLRAYPIVVLIVWLSLFALADVIVTADAPH